MIYFYKTGVIMNKFILFFISLLFLFCFPVFAQEETETETGIVAEYDPDTIFIINSFDFNITGITRPFALINKADLIRGEEITGYSNLDDYIKDKRQLLINQRVLKDNVRIEFTIGEPLIEGEDIRYPVDLIIFVEDTWNIVALPQPRYDTNYGFDLTIKARDYNFLGTMNPLRVDVGYRHDQEGHNFFNLMLDSGIPFTAFGLNWFFDFDHYFFYRPDVSKPFYYNNATGIYVEFPFGLTRLYVGFYEHFTVNEELSDADKLQYGTDFLEGLYMSSRPYISWVIPTGLEIGRYGELTYTPRLSAIFNHELAPWFLTDSKKGPFLTFTHSFSFGRIDWIGNFKKGYSFNLYNSFSYDFFYLRNELEPFSSEIYASGIGHFTLTSFMGFSTRLFYRHFFNNHTNYGGDVLRGVLDKNVSAEYMVSLNFDLPVRVVRFKPSEWLFKNGLELFNFDLHLSPVIDIAFFKEPGKPSAFEKENFLLSGGFEFIIFPDFFRSLYLRFSTGFNLLDPSDPIEFFIGMEFHF